jgi:predicted ribosome quality control (RQC) complex YloA/Tae2 family protein
MTYDGLVLAAVVAELERLITGGRIQRIRQHNATDITLEIRRPGRTYLLFISADARFPRIYLTSSVLPVPQQPPNFCMVLRKHIEGLFISRLEQVGFDRVLRLHLQASGQEERILVLEIMGKHSNLILIDSQERILGAAKHIGPSTSRYRQVAPGRQYIPPPATGKLDIRMLSENNLNSLIDELPKESADREIVKNWLINTFSGFGPFLAEEISMRAYIDGTVSSNRIRDELLVLRDTIRKSNYLPVLITSERGEALTAYPTPSVQFPADRQHARASINETLDTLFRSLVTRTELEDQRTQLLTAIRRAEGSRIQALKSIERTVAESKRAEDYRRIGDLLLANLNNIEKGAKSVRLIDYFNPDMPEIEVELDEKLAPQQNAERYFKRYRKARDAASTAEARRSTIMQEIALLKSAESEAEKAKSVDSLKSLREMLIAKALLRQESAQEKHDEEEFAGHRIKRVITSEGWEILYGENAAANDYLTQRIARPDDVWLHARAITGAHVIVRTAGHSGNVPKSVLLEAATIAARNSDAKHSSLVPVDHTLRKYVRKPRGSAPGFVTYRNEKTIDVSLKN